MTYDLFIGDRTFSSWSLRGWLMLAAFDLPFRSHTVGLYDGTMAADLAALIPARTVPVMRTPAGGVLTDSLAMAETLAESHPDANLYPDEPQARALARSMVAEMHSGFHALRGDCPMMLAHGWSGFVPSAAVRADLDRIETLWSLARSRHGSNGPWLFGSYTLADAFYAPVALRIATYDLPVSASAKTYVDAHLTHHLIRQWRATGLTRSYNPMPYALDLPKTPWPGPVPVPAQAVDTGTPENDRCPYSGDPVTHLLTMQDRIFGFCNAVCRDKAAIDPAAWPRFMALV
ncbi:glutathione S-transferase [Loktanella sp. SALINAS62]|uniref:glutathione S-transferase n=1 Tax=Loktanella sp. SALINAS62 TaxID=2706124 RepID=UPI001B8C788B|nr:glutathione S-transferase [Loktanella sp. SALINAS62]MBS1301265.1 glutathione S-transferase [Loktanella sp. SALINAS62]